MGMHREIISPHSSEGKVLLPCVHNRLKLKEKGFTLTEILIVVVIMGVIAAVAIPTFSSNDSKKVDVATNEVVQALRYARNEAIRSGKPYGVVVDFPGQRIRLFWLDTSGAFPVPSFTVRHPIDKKLYDLVFDTDAYPARLGNLDIKYKDVASAINIIGFSPYTGIPGYNDLGIVRMLETATINVSYRSETRNIKVASMTGRVTVK